MCGNFVYSMAMDEFYEGGGGSEPGGLLKIN